VSSLVSVVMNAYNGEIYLREAIESVLNQTYKNWELIFWDNRSTDNTAEIVKSYDDSRIHYQMATEHTTLGEARNLAVKKANGGWIAFLDTDDLWFADKLQKQCDLINDGVGIIYSRCLKMNSSGTETDVVPQYKNKKLPEGNILRILLLEGQIIPFPSLMVRKSAYWEAGGIPESYSCAEDYYLMVAIADNYEAKAVEDYTCKYRVHGENLSFKVKEELYTEPLQIVEKWGRFLTMKELGRRKKEYQTLLAFQTLRHNPVSGIKELFKNGSLLFIANKAVLRLRRFAR
jgi:glycosyltransferase involved in cell wall biosynthesis